MSSNEEQQMQRYARTLIAAIAAGTLSATAAHAQGAGADGRWQAWLGCWQPLGASASSASSAVCVVPAGGSSVDIATVSNGKVIGRQHVDPSGAEHPATRDGCTGWERASWSSDGHRVYLSSQYTCPGGNVRRSNGLFAFAPNGQWLDVQGVTVGRGSGVRVQRLEDIGNRSDIPAELADAIDTRGIAVSSARTAAGGTIGTADIIDASKHLDSGVVAAWLVERHQRFTVDASELARLADAGVPGTVTDAMIALSYPSKFAIRPPTTDQGVAVAAIPDSTPRDRGEYVGAGPVAVFDPWGYSPYGWGYGYDGYYGYGAYGYGAYGYGPGYYSPYGYGWYPGYTPIVIVKGNQQHGHVANGRGYTRGSDGSASTAETSRSSGSSGSGSSGSSSHSGGTSTGRTAHPRP